MRILEGPPPGATDWEYGFALICAGDFFSRAGRNADAVVVLSRAIEQADSIEDRSLSASAYWRLGEVYYETGDELSVVNAWDRLSELEAHLGTRAFRFQLATEMLSLANEAYASNDVERALDLAVRLESYHEGRDYGLSHSDPDWLPDAYLQSGNPTKAMKIHDARVIKARELGEPLEVSKRLRHYSNFLRETGNTERARETHEEADAFASSGCWNST